MANRRGKYDEAEKAALAGAPTKSLDEIYTEQLRAKFLKLPLACKTMIRDAMDEGIEWRGEDTQRAIEALGGRTHFQVVIDETREQRRIGISEYRKTSLDKIGTLKRRMLGKNVGGRA